MYKCTWLWAILIIAQIDALAQATLHHTESYRVFSEGAELMDKACYGQEMERFMTYHEIADQTLIRILSQYHTHEAAATTGYAHHVNDIKRFVEDHPVFPDLSKYDSLLDPKGFQKAKEERWQADLDSGIFSFQDSAGVEWAFRVAYQSLKSGQNLDESMRRFDQLKGGKHHRYFASNYYAGYLAYMHGDCEHSKADLKIAGRDTLYSTSCWQMLLGCALEQKDEITATFAIQSLEGLDTAAVPKVFYHKTGELLVEKGRYQDSKYYLAKAGLQSDETQGKHRIKKYKNALAAAKAGDLEQAAEGWRELAIGQDPIAQLSAYQLGMLYGKYNNHTLAEYAFDKARKLRHSDTIRESATANYVRSTFHQQEWDLVASGGMAYFTAFPRGQQQGAVARIMTLTMLQSDQFDRAEQAFGLTNGAQEDLQLLMQAYTLQRGLSDYQSEAYQSSLGWLGKTAQYEGDSTWTKDAAFLTGQSLLQIGEMDSARAIFQRFLDQDTDYREAAQLGIGYTYYTQGSYGKAFPYFQEVISASGEVDSVVKEEALGRIGDCYLVQRKYVMASKAYAEAAALSQDQDGYYWFQSGVAAKYAGRFADARRGFGKALASENIGELAPQARHYHGMVYFEAKSYEDAIREFTIFLKKYPNHPLAPEVLEQRALANHLYRLYPDAIADYQQIINAYPSSPQAAEAIRALTDLDSKGQKVASLDAYQQRFSKANPGDNTAADAELNAVMAEYMRGGYQEAIPKFEALIAKDPETNAAQKARFYLARAYQKTGNTDKSIENYKGVKGPLQPEAYNEIGNMLAAKYAHSEAISYYLQAEQNGSETEKAKAAAGLTECYFKTENWNKVTEYADKVVLLNEPNATAKALLYKGKALTNRKEYANAKQALTKAVMTGQGSIGAEAQYELGMVYRTETKYAPSTEAFFELKKKFPKEAKWISKSYLMVAKNDIDQGNIEQAKATLRSLLRSDVDPKLKAQAQRQIDELD